MIMGFGMPKAGRVPDVRKLSTVACAVLGFALSEAIGDVNFECLDRYPKSAVESK